MTTRLFVALACALAIADRVQGHEIPTKVVLRAFAKPEGRTLRFVVRVPLEAIRDIDFPTVGEGYIDLARSEPLLAPAAMQWVGDYVRFYENGKVLPPPTIVATRISLPLDLSFRDYEATLAQVLGPDLPADVGLPWRQAAFDMVLEYPIASATGEFAIEPKLAHLGQTTSSVVHFLPVGGAERVFQYTGNPGLVRLDPRWNQAALRFLVSGVEHILTGIDHLLFLVALIIPVRRVRLLIGVVTAFTVAHSITLLAAASGMVPSAGWFPPLVETLIAASIVYLVIENALGKSTAGRWAVAFGFGLVHGFGFSFGLADTLQFAGRHLTTSLLAFNVGVEIGQLAVVAVLVPVLHWATRRLPERAVVLTLSLLVGHTAWHWMTERWDMLSQYQFSWDELGLDRWVALRLAALTAIIGLGAWLARRLARTLARPASRANGVPLGSATIVEERR